MNSRYRLLLIACLLPLAVTVAQSGPPVTVSLFNESTSMPYTDWWSDPVHPGIRVGTAFPGNSDRRLQVYPAINLGYLLHRPLFQGVFANLEIAVGYRHRSGINLRSRLGAGYLVTFATGTEYRLDSGTLAPRRDRGNHRLMPSLSFGVGYRLQPRDPRSTEIFLEHQTWLEYPYAGDFIPLMSHTNVHLGATFHPFPNKTKAQ